MYSTSDLRLNEPRFASLPNIMKVGSATEITIERTKGELIVAHAGQEKTSEEAQA